MRYREREGSVRKGTRGKINRKTARFGKLKAKGRDDWKKGMVKEKERWERRVLKKWTDTKGIENYQKKERSGPKRE